MCAGEAQAATTEEAEVVDTTEEAEEVATGNVGAVGAMTDGGGVETAAVLLRAQGRQASWST